MSFTPYSWLTTCPSCDVNFKQALKDASAEELIGAIDLLLEKSHTETAYKAIASEICRRQDRKKLVSAPTPTSR